MRATGLFFTCALVVLSTIQSFAQTTNDYRSNVATTGNWNQTSSWQRYNGTTWVAATEYPGQSAGSKTVTIRDGDNITLNVSPANAIGALVVGEGTSGIFQTSNNDRTLNMDSMIVNAGGSLDLSRLTTTVSGVTKVYGDLVDNHDNGSITFTGKLTVYNSGEFSTSNDTPYNFRGGIDNDGTIDITGGNAVSFTNNTQTIEGTGVTTLSGVVTVTGITVNNQSTDLNLTATGNNSLTGTGTWAQATGGILNFSGASMNITNANFSASGNVVNYTRAGTQTIRSATYRDLSISSNGTKTLAGNITVNGNLAISGTATLASDVYSITGNATGTFTMASGTFLLLGRTNNAANVLFPSNFTAGNIALNSASTVTYQNNNAQTVSNTPTYGNLTIATGGTKTLSGNVTIAGNLSVSGGTFSLGTVATTVNITGTAAIAGTLSYNGTVVKTVNITGNLSGGGTINMSGGNLAHHLNLNGANNALTTLTAASAATVTYNRAGNQQIFGSTNYRNLTVSGSGTKTLQQAVTVAGVLTSNSGTTIDPAGRNLIVNGNAIIGGIITDGNTGGTNTFEDVDFAGGTLGGSVTDVFNITGNLSTTSGNGTIGRATLNVTGTTTIASGRTLTIDNNIGVKTFTGLITVNGTGVWNSTAVTTMARLVIRGGITVSSASGSFLADGATFNANQNISGAGPISFTDTVYINGNVNLTNTNTAGVTFNHILIGSAAGSTYTNGANGITYYQYTGAATQPMNTGTLTCTAVGNNFYYSRGGAQNLKAVTYHHLSIAGGSGIKSLQANTTVNGNLLIDSGTSLEVSGYNIGVTGTSTLNGAFTDNNDSGTNTFTGLLTVAATGSLTTANNSPFVFSGGITNNGTFNQTGTGAVSFTVNDQDISGTATMSFAGAVTIAANRTVSYKNTNATGITFTNTLNGSNGSSTWLSDVNTAVNYQPSAATQPMNTGVINASAAGNYFNYARNGAQDVKAAAPSYYHLTIKGGGTKTLQGNTTVGGNLLVSASTTLEASSYDIAVTGTSTLYGTFTDANNSGTNTFGGALTIADIGSLTTANNSPFVFGGGITNEGTFTQTGTGAVSFTNNQTIDGTTPLTFGGAITISAGRTVTHANSSSGITMNGVLNGANAAATWKNDVNTTVYYQPAANAQPMNTGILDVSASGNNFYYSRASGTQTLKVPDAGYYNLIINGGNSITKVLGANTLVHNNLTIEPSTTLDVDNTQNYSLTVKGNFINDGIFLARNGTVTFSGTSDQVITTNGSSFYNMVIDNDATQVSMTDDLTVSNVLTLTDGVVTTGALNRLIVTSSAANAVTGYSSASFINGNLRRYFATNTDTYIFPIGNGTSATNYYQADLINNNLAGITYIDSRFKPLTNHLDVEMIAADNWTGGSLTYTAMQTEGVWELEPNAQPSGGAYGIRLFITNMSGLTDNEFALLKRPVGSTSGADWTTGGGTINPNDADGRTVASGYMKRIGLTSFSEFGAARGNGDGVGLPIELLSFTAQPQNNSVHLQWSTATEINNAFFTVERSQNGIDFETLSTFEGAGNSSETTTYQTFDREPFSGVSYYRLKQTDYDGQFTYSDIVSVEIRNTFSDHNTPLFTVFPNPVTYGKLFIRTENLALNEMPLFMQITDMSGRTVYDASLQSENAEQVEIALPENLQAGIYFVNLHTGKIKVSRRFVVQ